ncbi:ABC transporter permease [Dyella tabacisoli]|uniref:Peptide ABC transporter permease n=1 Tax=Dyella tabacisoli TaxID=2282381 RepID=A0A369USK6_9GAMM|nr:FtsX-like permease family protein [Dyella tabacisoli]RDD83025.1 peptide ABC transporter permease [Dyella tabacisoli]
MQIKPILSALRHHKAGTFLIALQMALTLAIVCNALFIIHERIEHLSRPTGIEESNLLMIDNHWVGKKDDDYSPAKTDLVALRQIPGVVDAYSSNAYPLIGGGWASGVRKDPAAVEQVGVTAVYFVDEHALSVLGVKLVAGRNFRPDEIGEMRQNGNPDAPIIIITKALADKAFPNGSALGKPLYLGTRGGRPSTVIGVIERLQAPSPSPGEDARSQYSTLVPWLIGGDSNNFIVRTRPGQLDAVVKAAPAALNTISRLRVIPDGGVRTFADVRKEAYKSDRGMVELMSVVCVVLLAITAAGIVGLTSFWVGQRRKQIGVRRALGATKNDILSYFLTENFLISFGGVVVGTLLAVGLNLWMMAQFEMNRLSTGYVLSGVVALLLLGQAAVLAPAMRASRVPPVEATRTV